MSESFGDEPRIREGGITLGEGEVSELTLELEPAHTAPNDGRARLHGRYAVELGPRDRLVLALDSEGRGAWRLAGLQPGRYSASLGVSGPARSAPREFELGPNGASGMELKFEVENRKESR